MAEILSREKELFNINQELNLMALNPTQDGSHVLTESRYGTYLKQRGPSTLLKKKLNMETTNRPTGRGQKTKMLKSPNNKNVELATMQSPSPQLTTPRGKPTTTAVKTKTPDWRIGKTSGKSAPNPTQVAPAGRVESTFTRRASHKTATYVKYRNPNFKQSPSLDLLLRNGDELVGHQAMAEVEVMQQTRESTTVVNGQSKKQLTQDNFIRFLKAKVTILEEDHGQLTLDMAELKERLEETLQTLRTTEHQRDQALTTNAKLSEQLHRLELQADETSRRQKECQSECNSQQHELELLRRDVKILKQTNANLESRLMRANQDAEAHRQMVTQQASQQREDIEYNRRELKVRDNRIKALKRQRADLLNAYKKQLFMIDNLKRQNSCVEQAVAVGFGEKEFNKVLEWNAGAKAVF